MKTLIGNLTLAVSCLLASAGVASAQATETPTYTNVRVISVDPASRTIVLMSPKGVKESLVFDDLLAGTGSIKAGDAVIVTIRGGPGRKRLSAISKVRAAVVLVPTSQVPLGLTSADPVARDTREGFSREVLTLSQEARSIDATWASFVTACNVKPVSNEGGGRDWFGLWDGRVQADYSAGHCRELFNQIVNSGEGIKKGMAAAEETVKNTLTPGDIREIRTLHAMNWDGWTLPPPPRRDP